MADYKNINWNYNDNDGDPTAWTGNRVRLKFDSPKEGEGQYGKYYIYGVQDMDNGDEDSSFLASEAVHKKIAAQGAVKGSELQIIKTTGKTSKETRWYVKHIGGPKGTAPAPAQTNGPISAGNGSSNGQFRQAAPPPPRQQQQVNYNSGSDPIYKPIGSKGVGVAKAMLVDYARLYKVAYDIGAEMFPDFDEEGKRSWATGASIWIGKQMFAQIGTSDIQKLEGMAAGNSPDLHDDPDYDEDEDDFGLDGDDPEPAEDLATIRATVRLDVLARASNMDVAVIAACPRYADNPHQRKAALKKCAEAMDMKAIPGGTTDEDVDKRGALFDAVCLYHDYREAGTDENEALRDAVFNALVPSASKQTA